MTDTANGPTGGAVGAPVGGVAAAVAGLTTAEADRRLAEVGPNALPPARRASLLARTGRELREPMAVLLLGAAAVSGIWLGEVVDAVAIAVIVLLNAVISLVQQGRAERALEALQALEAPSAVVVRDGVRRVVPAVELVPGDWVVVQAGDRVPADVELRRTDGVEVDESVLTGESLPVAKRTGGTTDPNSPLGDRDGMLLAGTLLTRGLAEGEVSGTGPRSALGVIAAGLHAVRQEPSPLQVQLTDLSRRLGLAALLVAIGTAAVISLTGAAEGAEEVFLVAVALAVAAVPEGLAAVTTVALALGVARMAGHGAIVRRLPAVETLGSTDVLVIDKTGTVTENRMSMAALVDAAGVVTAPSDAPGWLRESADPVLVLCNDASTDPPVGDPTERALLAGWTPGAVERYRLAHPRLGVEPFTSERRRMSVVANVDARPVLLVKGAPEVVLRRCTEAIGEGGTGRLTDAQRRDLLDVADSRAARGERVLALARRQLTAVPDDVEAAEQDLCVVGLVVLRDPPRASAADSVAAVQSCGMRLIMATGDHPATARSIAAEVGMDGRGDLLTGADVRAHGLPADPAETSVYARLDPHQKLALVSQLRDQGHVVAMTGDGVNDAPALRLADIGVALGATGSDVAREAADLVITDDDLATIVTAVREGRGIYDNIRKVVDYLVTSNLAEITTVVTVLIVLPSFGVPLLPLQLLWINLLTDGLPALALGVDPHDPAIMRRPPRPAGARFLDWAHVRGMASHAVVLSASAVASVLLARLVLDLSVAESRTVLFTNVVLAQILYAFVVHRGARGSVAPTVNRWLWLAAGSAVALQVLIVLLPAAQPVFDTVAPSAAGWLLALGSGVVAPALLATSRRIGDR